MANSLLNGDKEMTLLFEPIFERFKVDNLDGLSMEAMPGSGLVSDDLRSTSVVRCDRPK